MTKNDGGPAFPLPGWDQIPWPSAAGPDFGTGMTLRDWLAGQALVAMGTWVPCEEGFVPDDIKAAKAKWAYEQADAMLSHRNKE